MIFFLVLHISYGQLKTNMKDFFKAVQTILFLASLLLSEVTSQDYLIKNYNIHNGLAQSTVRDLYQDSNGFIWVGTENGLSCFDGKTFKTYKKPEELFNAPIAPTDQAPNGNLLLLTLTGKIWEFDGTEFRKYQIQGLDSNLLISDFKVINDGFLVSTRRSGCYFTMGKEIKHWDVSNGLFDNYAINISEDKYSIYIVTMGGVHEFKDNEVYPLFKNPDFKITAIIKDSQENFWAGGWREGIFKLETDGKWVRKYSFNRLFTNGFVEDENKNIWASTNAGLKRITQLPDGSIEIYDEINMLQVRSLSLDNENGILCGSFGNGLFHLSENLFKNYTPETGFPTYFSKILLQDSKDRIWIQAGRNGSLMFDGEKFNLYDESNGNDFHYVTDATENSKGEIVLSADNKLFKFNGSYFTQFNSSPEEGLLKEVFYDYQNQLWISITGNGVWRLINNKWQQFELLPSDCSIRYFYEDSHKNIWFASFIKGVFKYDGNKIVNINEKHGLTDNRAMAINEDSQNNIWVATRNKISIIKNDKVIDTLSVDDGLSGNIVYSLGKYDNKMLIGTADGFAIHDDNEIKFFTTVEGLSSNEISDGDIPVTADGKAWIASTAGVSTFDLKKYLTKNYFSKAYLSKIITDEDTVEFNFFNQRENLNDLKFSSSLDFIHLDLNTINFLKEISSYRFKLNNKNETTNWVYSDSKRLTIENPVAGEYSLLIETKSFGEDWKPAYSIAITIIDPFYKTNSFYAGMLIFTLITSLSYYQFNMYKKRKNKYRTSSFNKVKSRELKEKIINLFEVGKTYKDPKITLQQVADKLKIPKEHISQLINSEFGQNFNDFVNTYRVNEAKEMLAKNGDLKMQILEIAYEVGFNSKSSFNTAFKKFTGLTPSEFKKRNLIHS